MDTRAEAAEVIKGQLLALEGFDEELVRGMDLVEIVPSVLEDGEMPEAVQIGRWSHHTLAHVFEPRGHAQARP